MVPLAFAIVADENLTEFVFPGFYLAHRGNPQTCRISKIILIKPLALNDSECRRHSFFCQIFTNSTKTLSSHNFHDELQLWLERGDSSRYLYLYE